jgi:two-component system sensor histidine kinase KdpD
MARGQLRVYLGSAPGVGKTYRMLDEGLRRRDRGTDVVVGYVETHRRPNTDAQIRDLEIVPRMTLEYRGAKLEEMDLEAVLSRRPDVALVDELAHTNVPGSSNEKRWMDVEALLAAGIDVITTINIQHLESVNDVVEKITGITQQETVPDAIVRRAEQIELVDVTPEALRRRMAHGNIYAADKIDTSLSNYFRVGNLSALRELALLWLADRVEDALQRYQDDHDIAQTWETRERLIIGINGNQADEILLRRAARIASRTGAEILAVHVVNADAMHDANVDTSLARELTAEFEGKFQEIVDDDVASALVSFARSERGTQIVLGASRPRSALHPRAGVVEHVLRHTSDFDVHVIAVGDERPTHVHKRRQKRQISWKRQLVAFTLAALSMSLLTFVLTAARSSLSNSTEFLAYLILVLALTTWGGAAVGVVSGIAAFGVENYYFVTPLHTLQVSRPDDAVSLAGFLIFAVGASMVMSRFARRSHEADRARAEAQILAKAVANVGTSPEDFLPILDSLRAVFNASAVALLTRNDGSWLPDVLSGEAIRVDAVTTQFSVDDDHMLVLAGVSLDAEDRELINAFAGRIANGLRAMVKFQDAAELRATSQVQLSRSGLLRAVSSDVSGSLATMQFKLTSLLDGDDTAPAKVQRERLQAVESEVQHLTRLVANLVEVDRLERGSVIPERVSTSLDVLVEHAVAIESERGRTFDIDIAPDLPPVLTDPAMLERALAIVLRNACRFSPGDSPVRVTAGVTGNAVELLIIDRGPGIATTRRAAMLDVLRRFGAEEKGTNLGLNVVSGLVHVLGGQLRFEDTPGGGLTVVLEFLRRDAVPASDEA